MKHKHAELIKAWADGAEIEEVYLYGAKENWEDFGGDWDNKYLTFRIKPTPKPDVVKLFRCSVNNLQLYRVEHPRNADIKVTFDGETGEIKSAEVIK